MAHSSGDYEITLTLSGGGLRAASFHLGVLVRLAVEGVLEKVATLSTVSGGSIFASAMFGSTPEWPSSSAFLTSRYTALRSLLTTRDLFTLSAIGWGGLVRYNVALFNHRAAVLADLLRRRWGITASLSDLPKRPLWWINSTNLRTGKNWRFARDEMGDWVHGRRAAPNHGIAEAVAASAAVPYLIGALRLTLPVDDWYLTEPRTRQRTAITSAVPKEVHLWDGGVYENLGLEAVYKPGKAADAHQLLIVSDASGELGLPFGNPLLSILKGHLAAPRLFDIAADQNRSLRSRMLVRDFEAGKVVGALLRMGNSTRYIHHQAGVLLPGEEFASYLSPEAIDDAFAYPVDLDALPVEAFELLCRHGFEVADATLTAYLPNYFKTRQAFPM